MVVTAFSSPKPMDLDNNPDKISIAHEVSSKEINDLQNKEFFQGGIRTNRRLIYWKYAGCILLLIGKIVNLVPLYKWII